MAKNNAQDDSAEKAAAEKAEAEAAEKAANEPDPCLITLTKGEETIKAHPIQVPLWMEQGWTVAIEESGE